MQKRTNALIHETSPYLLQHAHNPVDWYPWGEQALNKAREENKPILVSIGYSACHWCHVMEKESFEDETTAAVMNEHFINIKVDREERPDLDHIYMDAVQAMTGSGGWPLNVFLTPEGKPFYGGTYFPPRNLYNRPSWQEVLASVSQAFRERRHEIDAQAENLTGHLEQANSFGIQKAKEDWFAAERLDEAYGNIMKMADREWGGFGKAPKFPQTFTIQFLLRYHYIKNLESTTKKKSSVNKEGSEAPSTISRQRFADGDAGEGLGEASLDKMIQGGIYDQAGGGFARYSTDREWLVPHFEKMLYDNALLISVLSEAYQLTKKGSYKKVIDETMEFVQRELMHPDRGFYAALDADSEGEEGKFYVWDYEEVMQLLGEKEATIFCEYYDITPGGNWEAKNILRVKEPAQQFSERKKMPVTDLELLVERGKKKLMAVRGKRVRPGLDDKIILGWNALMNTAASKAFAATGNEEYKQLAVDNMNFLFEKLVIPSGEFQHTWKNGQAKFPAFLDDYAFLIQALIQLQEITAEIRWLEKAEELARFVIDHFSEEETGFFFYTKKGQADIIVRKKEVYDGALPSGNAIMAYNLYQLSLLFDRGDWRERSMNMVGSLAGAVVKYPSSFGVWAGLLLEVSAGTNEIAITGTRYYPTLKELLAAYIPNRVLMASDKPSDLPLLAGKPLTQETAIWLCRNYSCKQPVSTAASLITLINRGEAAN